MSEEGDIDNLELQKPPVQQQPMFALSPYQINSNQQIYYSTENGLKVYRSTIDSLTDPLYNGKPDNLKLFRHVFKDRV